MVQVDTTYLMSFVQTAWNIVSLRKMKKVRCTIDIRNQIIKGIITRGKAYDVIWSNQYGFTFLNDNGKLSLGRFKNCHIINGDWEVI